MLYKCTKDTNKATTVKHISPKALICFIISFIDLSYNITNKNAYGILTHPKAFISD